MTALMTGLANHLWQSTLFALVVAFIAFLLGNNQAKIRYGLWLAASLKFLLPFSLLLSLGSRIEAPAIAPNLSAMTVVQITESFAPVGEISASPWRPELSPWPKVALSLGALWALGSAFLLFRWTRQWLVLRTAAARATAMPLAAPIRALESPVPIEPGVFGIIRPVLLLPQGIQGRLSTEEFAAVLAHELTHIRRRDNLTAALHMLVECAFWFHPLVWWIGSKLVVERERACDEAVLEAGGAPHVYAQGILNVCKFYVESPLPCASGVSGADLRKRIAEIMNGGASLRLSAARKWALGCAAVAALGAPLVIGLLRAQTLPPAPQYKFEVASIRPSKAPDSTNRLGPGPNGGLRAQNVTVLGMIGFAYGLRPFQVSGGPKWMDSDRFDVVATPEQPEATPSPGMPRADFEKSVGRLRERVQWLLATRFGLVLRAETKEMQAYVLTRDRGEHKLKPATEATPPNLSSRPGSVKGRSAAMKNFAFSLAGVLRQPVVDETGLDGVYDFSVEWTPDDPSDAGGAADTGASVFTAIREQLGLRLESKKTRVPVFVVEKLEKPTEN